MVASVSFSGKEESAVSAVPLDFENCVDLFGGDRNQVLNLVRDFIESLDVQINLLAKALAEANPETISKVSHSIKGSAAVLSANSVMDAATILEQIAKSGDLTRGKEGLLHLTSEVSILKKYCNNLLGNKG